MRSMHSVSLFTFGLCGLLVVGFLEATDGDLSPASALGGAFTVEMGDDGMPYIAIDPEGRVFMGTGDAPFSAETNSLGTAVVAVKLDANKQLQFVDYFAPPNANWLFRRDLDLNVSPVAFDYRGRKFLIATSKECKLWLLDRDDLGGTDNRTTLQTTPLLCNDAQAFDGDSGSNPRMRARPASIVRLSAGIAVFLVR